MSNIYTLVEDIFTLLEKGKEGIDERNVREFFKALREDINTFLSPDDRDRSGKLRMSSIGRPDRKLWYEFHDKKKRNLPGQIRLRFFFGNLVESFLLFLAQEAGHTVTDRQKEVILEGIKGHIDAKIDGHVVDVKSASDFGFKKFIENSLSEDDPFGYMGQLSSYVQAEGDTSGYFLAYNKSNAAMHLLEIDELTSIDAKKRIQHVKKVMKRKTAPDRCYPDQPEGKHGNRSLNKACTFCDYKYECWADVNGGAGLRVFEYSRGPKYFTHIEKEPKVDELLF